MLRNMKVFDFELPSTTLRACNSILKSMFRILKNLRVSEVERRAKTQ